ncbi:MAGE-domain-containing protein [Gloeophyllum trabeum ATCC 11539]|uniref:MAGE-domain-containing protein n=1 Tax=Gloeophyllum trabeum (strain ATCC 11539 / FP-39264 / Madison 617) TaxID=670483 RepID=S7Q094_GLOTA|nr:MAGE-domain-containing protein [Gloeophyllum trabeum ATCC 11539]EPQ53113.1 MAGE-domain-containing protein [Gloeophyllum trabeum ATCC 11539]
MARAGPSRSQRASQPSQPQRPRRGRDTPRDEEDSAASAEEGDENGNEEMEIDEDLHRDKGESEIYRKANDLVRLALFTEHRRVPLRREEISKKVLGSNTRSFNVVMEQAQKILRKTFGMELVELRSRAGLDQEENAEADGEERTGLKKKGASLWTPSPTVVLTSCITAAAAGSKTYILRSVLDSNLIELAAITDAAIIEEEIVDIPDNDDDEETYRTYGSIISWSSADQLQAIGILYVVLALILVHGKSLNDMALRAYLKKLRLPPNAPVNFTPTSTHKTLPIDTYLSQLVRQGYLDRQRVGENAQKGGKRGRAPATQAGEDNAAIEWRWGTRALSEVGEVGIARFVAEFMVERQVEDEEEDGEEDNERRARKREQENRKKVEAMVKGIKRAANGSLSDVK